MLRRDHFKIKLVSFVILNILLCAMFFIFPSLEPNGESLWVWHLRLGLVYYPLTALVYGITTVITAFRDRGYIALMTVIFLVCALLNGIAKEVVEVPASLIYTAIMIGAALLAAAVKALILAIVGSYKLYKQKKDKFL